MGGALIGPIIATSITASTAVRQKKRKQAAEEKAAREEKKAQGILAQKERDSRARTAHRSGTLLTDQSDQRNLLGGNIDLG